LIILFKQTQLQYFKYITLEQTEHRHPHTDTHTHACSHTHNYSVSTKNHIPRWYSWAF